MNTRPPLLALFAVLTPLACLPPAVAKAKEPTPETAALIAEGRRLVENVGLCADCHTPRRPDGSLDTSRHLMGASLPYEPTVEMPWAGYALPIAGLKRFSDAQAVKFLTTGERPGGPPARPPMPAYRFNEDEAKAIVAYLKSLPAR